MSLRSIVITKPPSTPIVSTAASDTRGRLIIAIEGNIGIGKSTLLANLRKHFALDESVAIVDEPVALWEEHGLLEAMYTDTLSRCAFQLMALTTRYTALLDALASKAKVIITERSVRV
jgi:deoxyadenosine/deoxycytidine kinase